ncbi:MAG: DUF484 family protein [Pseudomonadota bacterium]
MDATFKLDGEERELVRSLIIADPDLILGDDDVMRRLVGEETGSRKVVDLRDRLVERMEQRLEKMVTQHRSVIAAAYENVAGTNQLHKAVLWLIEPPDLSSFLHRLTHDVPAFLGLEEARLCLETDVTETGPAAGFSDDLAGRVIAVPQGMIAKYLSFSGEPDASAVVLRPAGEEAELIFGEANPVQSEALLRLDIAGSPGMLALGSGDPKKFDPAHGTDLLQFFGGVIERLLIQRLADPNL